MPPGRKPGNKKKTGISAIDREIRRKATALRVQKYRSNLSDGQRAQIREKDRQRQRRLRGEGKTWSGATSYLKEKKLEYKLLLEK